MLFRRVKTPNSSATKQSAKNPKRKGGKDNKVDDDSDITSNVQLYEHEEGDYQRTLTETKDRAIREGKKQLSQHPKERNCHHNIHSHVNCYEHYINHTDSREVSEEYDIESDISGLTRESDFTVEEDKENHRPSKSRKTIRRKKRTSRKTELESSSNKSSFQMANLSIFGSRRGWRGKANCKLSSNKTTTERKHKTPRARSLPPRRSHATSLLSLPSQDLGKSFVDYPSRGEDTGGIPKATNKRSKSADVTGRRREPSPTRLAHPYYHSLTEGALVSPEPLGKKLEDFAFRTPQKADCSDRAEPLGTVSSNRAEPLGKRLDTLPNSQTPRTVDIYVEETTPTTQNNSIIQSYKSDMDKINEIYRDIDRDKNGGEPVKEIDVDVDELEAQLPSLSRTCDSSKRLPDFTGPTRTDNKQMLWVNDDPYSGRAKARVRSRLRHRQKIKSTAPTDEVAIAMDIIHPPSVLSIEGSSVEDAMSSLDGDRSDSFDWKAFANYLDSKPDKLVLHRSKYKSFFNSARSVDIASVGSPEDSVDVSPKMPARILRRSRSTDELLPRPLDVTGKPSLSTSRSKEYLEFSPRESGGFLQATCFKEKTSVKFHRRGKSLGHVQSNEMDWMESIGDENATMQHNDSHELHSQAKPTPKDSNMVENRRPPRDSTQKLSTRVRKHRNDKTAIRAITKEASSKSLLTPSGGDEDDNSNFDEDLIADLYQSQKINKSKISRERKEILCHLPIKDREILPNEDREILNLKNASALLEKASKNQFDLFGTPKTISTSQRKKLISEFLSARDGSSLRNAPRVPSDPPEILSTPTSKPHIPPRSKAYDDYQAVYSVPTLGISPRSATSVHGDDYASTSSITWMRSNKKNDGPRSMSSPVLTKVVSQADRLSLSSEKREMVSVKRRRKKNACLSRNTVKRSQHSRLTSTAGYAYLSSDGSSAASSPVNLKSVKLPVLTPKTVSSRSTGACTKEEYFSSPMTEPHQVFDEAKH
jgi:hypothetical protein